MADLSYEDVMNALRNADAAGDTEAATRLAEIASSMMGSIGETTEKPPEAEQRSFIDELGRQVGLTARGAYTGAMAIPAMVADAPVSLANYFGADLPLPSKAQQKLLSDIGLPEPENKLERAVQAGVGAMTGVGAEAALAKGISSPLTRIATDPTKQMAAAQQAAQATTTSATGAGVVSPLTKQLGTQTGVAGVAAPISQTVSESVTEQTENPVLSIAAGIAAGVMSGGATAKAIKLGQPVPKTVSIEDVRKQASQAYNEVKEAGITMKPLSALGMVKNIRKDLEEFNFNPALPDHKPVDTLLNQFEMVIGQKRVKFDVLEQMRQAANQMRMTNDPVTKLLAGQVVNSIDKFMGGVSPTDIITGKENVGTAIKTLMNARNKWKVSSRAQILEDVLDVSAAKALDPKASESELIRRGLINLAANKKRMALFNKDEQQAIKQAANSGSKDMLLSFISRFNPQRSQLIAGGTVGAAFVEPLSAAAIATTGFAADKMQQAMRTKQTQKLISDMLAGRIQAPDVNSPGYRALIESLKASSQ